MISSFSLQGIEDFLRFSSSLVWRVAVGFSTKREAVVLESKVAHAGALRRRIVLAASPRRGKGCIFDFSAVVEVAI